MRSRPLLRRRTAPLVLALVGLALPAGPLRAQAPRLVVDLSPGTSDRPAYPRFLTAVGDQLFFVAGTRAEGSELWVSDGTREGTRLVSDLVPGPQPPTSGLPYQETCGFGPQEFVRVGGRLLFVAPGSRSRTGLYVTDGTGVTAVPFPSGSTSFTAALTAEAPGGAWVLGGWNGRYRLFLTDGTAEGTRLVAPIEGTPLDLVTIADGFVAILTVRTESGTYELWRSDGTPEGTRRYARLPGRSIPWMRHAAERVAVFTLDDGVHGTEPWRTDGTVEGTELLADLAPGPDSSYFSRAVKTGSTTVFTASPGPALWTWDGSSPPIRLASTADYTLVAGTSTVWFVGTDPEHGAEPWQTDGTPAGTRLARDLNPGTAGSSPTLLAELNGNVYAFGTEAQGGTGLYRIPVAGGAAERLLGGRASSVSCYGGARLSAPLSDGSLAFVYSDGNLDRVARTDRTPAGTHDLFDGTAGASSFGETWTPGGPGPLSLDGRLFLASVSPVAPYYPVLATDGTPEGTAPVVAPSGEQLYLSPAASIGSTLYLAVTGEVHRLDRGRNVTERLWGFTGGETHWVTGLAAARDHLVVTTYSQPNQRLRHWGWAAGMAGPVELGPFLGGNVPWQGRVAFVSRVSDSGLGGDLAVTDGTPEGTRPLGPRDVLTRLLPDGRQLFYWRSVSKDLELWRTDGSPGGEVRIWSRTYDSPQATPPDIATLGSSALLRRGFDHLFTELVRLGPSAGEEVVIGLARGSDFPDGVFKELTPLGRRVFFRHGSPELGLELWSTDGTPEGTGPVADILPGPEGSRPADLTVVDGILLFAASDGVHGVEPWRSDGTAAGTWRLADVAPGTRSSNPARFVRVCSQILFLAESPDTGRELWALDPLVAGLPPTLPCRTAPDAPSEGEPKPATPGR